MEEAKDFDQRQINEGLYLYKRAKSRRWQARIKRTSNEWFAMSCGTTDFEQAKQVAIKRQSELVDAQSQGLVDVSRRFVDIARLTIRNLDAETAANVGKSVNRDYKSVINRYLIPVLGKYQITSIDYKAIIALDAYRRKKLGREPSKSTINTHNAALNRVFKTAVDRGFLLPLQIPALVNRGRAMKSRPYFDQQDYKLLARNLREFVNTGHKTSTKQLRDLLRDYVLILAHTGMRPGIESMNLKWNQIKHARQRDNSSPKREMIDVLKFSVVGKKRTRTLICHDQNSNVSTPLKRIQSRFAELATLNVDDLDKIDNYVFCTADGKRPNHQRLTKAFKIFLQKYNLLQDTEGQVRTLYSLRHTYATNAIRNHIGYDELALQMGTSRAMLERHYSKFRVEDRAAAFSGLDAARKRLAIDEKSELEKTLAMNETLQDTIDTLRETIASLNNSLAALTMKN